MSISIIVANDHPFILYALESLFLQESNVQVQASCQDGEETLQAVHHHLPDILILGLRLSRKDGLEVIRELHKERLRTRVVVLERDLDENTVFRLLRLGVSGIVHKKMEPQLLGQCIRKVYAGELWVGRRSTSRALERLVRCETETRECANFLTSRQLEIVRLIASGLHNKTIAEQLHIGEGTVKTHLHHIYDKLRLGGRLALLRYAQDKGLVGLLFWVASTYFWFGSLSF